MRRQWFSFRREGKGQLAMCPGPPGSLLFCHQRLSWRHNLDQGPDCAPHSQGTSRAQAFPTAGTRVALGHPTLPHTLHRSRPSVHQGQTHRPFKVGRPPHTREPAPLPREGSSLPRGARTV